MDVIHDLLKQTSYKFSEKILIGNSRSSPNLVSVLLVSDFHHSLVLLTDSNTIIIIALKLLIIYSGGSQAIFLPFFYEMVENKIYCFC